MGKHIVRRLLLLIPVVFVVYTVAFVFIRVAPGDVVTLLLEEGGGGGTAEAAEHLRAELHLDKPVYQQYLIYTGELLTGDLGTSFLSGRPVTSEIIRRAPITLEITFIAMVAAFLISVPTGVISAVRQSTPVDHVTRVTTVVFLAVPNFWLATMVVVLPAIWWKYSPPVIYKGFLDDPLANLSQVLPAALVLGASYGGVLARFVRSSLLEVLREDYIRTARAKGLTERKVTYRHAMKNAMLPVVTIAGLQFAILLGGAIIVETVFNIPGLGTLTVQAIRQRDYAQLQANVLFFAAIVVLINLAVDLSYAWLDPRVRYG